MTKIMTVEELSEKLKVPKSWIYSRTRESGPGAIPKFKVGKYLRFFENEVMRWLENENQKI